MSDRWGRVRFTLTTPVWRGRVRLKAFYWRHIRGYEYEICQRCGGPVGHCTGSWWGAPDYLWDRVVGEPTGVFCPPCFTTLADDAGCPIHWEAVAGV